MPISYEEITTIEKMLTNGEQDQIPKEVLQRLIDNHHQLVEALIYCSSIFAGLTPRNRHTMAEAAQLVNAALKDRDFVEIKSSYNQ